MYVFLRFFSCVQCDVGFWPPFGMASVRVTAVWSRCVVKVAIVFNADEGVDGIVVLVVADAARKSRYSAATSATGKATWAIRTLDVSSSAGRCCCCWRR